VFTVKIQAEQIALTYFDQIIAVSLNPAIDRVVEAPGFQAGGHQRVRRVARYPAGKAINVARAMAALDQQAVVTGFVGEAEAAWYRQFLQEEGIVDCRLTPVKGSTRENISIADPLSTNTDTHLIEEGFTVTSSDVAQLRDVLGSFAIGGRLIAFSGSLPTGLSVEQFTELLQYCLDSGAEVAVDSSGAALSAAADLPLWLVKPNRQELEEMAGSSLQTYEQQKDIASKLAQRIRWVLVSAGAEGAWLFDKHNSRRAVLKLPADEIVGTVGCGDVLFGGFLAGWQHASRSDTAPDAESPAADALRHGVAAATFSATQLMRAVDATNVKRLEPDVKVSDD